jgi:ubiquinone/menaquinone biosynthesis C-methylase UbiE
MLKLNEVKMNHNDLIKEQFDKQSATFGSITGHYDALDLIAKLAQASKKDTVLDVACGPGIVACALAKNVARVQGIDLVPAMIERAKEAQKAQGLTNLSWDIGNVNPLPYEHCSYSIVVSRFAFHHFTDPQAVLLEMARVAKWEGRVVVVDVYMTSKTQADLYDHMEKLRDPSHTHALQISELQSMFKQADLSLIEQYMYRMEVNVDELLKATVTPENEAEEFRRIVKTDVGINVLGINASMKDNQLTFSFPIVIMVGVKQVPENYGQSCCDRKD